jgi:hypothetical protein
MFNVCYAMHLKIGRFELPSSFSSIASSLPYNIQSPLAKIAVVLAKFRILG